MGHVGYRPTHAGDLAATLQTAFALLARGVADRRSHFHTPVLGTVGRDGRPRLRTLVLRGFDAAERTLRLHTDNRTEKAADILTQPRVSLLGYDPGQRVQMRLDALATLHTDDAVADAGWAASRDFSRMAYAVEPAPGRPAAEPPPAPLDPAAGRPNFAVILLRFDRLEWLWLAAEGHQRALFTWDAEPNAAWLVP
jgi:pyridoxamine 5'-phosphate oxidase